MGQHITQVDAFTDTPFGGNPAAVCLLAEPADARWMQQVALDAAGSAGDDFVSRFFAPRAGINEDPATGSSHCTLAPFWMQRLGKSKMAAYQASPRGGVLRVRMNGERVCIGGQAVTVLRGELLA